VEDAYWSGGAWPHPGRLRGGVCPASSATRLGRPDPTRRRPSHTTSGTLTGPARFVSARRLWRTVAGRAAGAAGAGAKSLSRTDAQVPRQRGLSGSPGTGPCCGVAAPRRDGSGPSRPGRTARARAVIDRTIPPGSRRTRLRTVTTASVGPQAHATSSAPFAAATAPALAAGSPPPTGPTGTEGRPWEAPGPPPGVSAPSAARSAAACVRARATTSTPTSSAIKPAHITRTVSARAISVTEPACHRPGRPMHVLSRCRGRTCHRPGRPMHVLSRCRGRTCHRPGRPRTVLSRCRGRNGEALVAARRQEPCGPTLMSRRGPVVVPARPPPPPQPGR
jgi:hypothetical protein